MSTSASTTEEGRKYWAFISYSSKDSHWGQWVIRSIETYRIPKSLVGLRSACGSIPDRLYPVFRDRDELRVGADVGEELRQALASSRHLIVVCSPYSADPTSWVNKEITSFQVMGRERDVMGLVVAGVPNASNMAGSEAQECFPLALRYAVNSDGSLTEERAEPLATDVTREDERPRASRRKALLKLIARMIDVDFDTLEQRDRRRRKQRIVAWSISAIILLGALLGLAALWLAADAHATSQELAKQAKEKLATEPDLAFLLGIEAYRIRSTVTAYDSLLTMVHEKPHLLTHLHRGNGVSAVALGKDGKLGAVADCGDESCTHHRIHLYDLATGQPMVEPIHIDGGAVEALEFRHPMDQLLAVTRTESSSQLLAIDLITPHAAPASKYRDRREITSIASSGDGRRYAVALENGEFKIFDETGGQPCIHSLLREQVVATAFSPNGQRFAAGGIEGQIIVVNLADCKQQQLILGERLGALAFDASGERLTAIILDGTIKEWALKTRPRRETFRATGHMLNGYVHAFNGDARYDTSHPVILRRFASTTSTNGAS